MVSLQDHRKIFVFSVFRLRGFAQYLEQYQVNEDWVIFWRYFAKQQIILLRNKRKRFRWSDIWYVGDSVPFSHLAHIENQITCLLSVFPSLTPLCLSPGPRFTIDHTGQYHIELLRPLISALQADLFTTRWPWLFGVHSSYPNFLMTAKWYAVTSLSFSAIDGHDMLHEALGYRASSSLYLSLNCSFSDSFMSVFSGRSHHLLFPSRS